MGATVETLFYKSREIEEYEMQGEFSISGRNVKQKLRGQRIDQIPTDICYRENGTLAVLVMDWEGGNVSSSVRAYSFMSSNKWNVVTVLDYAEPDEDYDNSFECSPTETRDYNLENIAGHFAFKPCRCNLSSCEDVESFVNRFHKIIGNNRLAQYDSLAKVFHWKSYALPQSINGLLQELPQLKNPFNESQYWKGVRYEYWNVLLRHGTYANLNVLLRHNLQKPTSAWELLYEASQSSHGFYPIQLELPKNNSDTVHGAICSSDCGWNGRYQSFRMDLDRLNGQLE